jgi:nucleotide-binding universal stress UspA family protein
MSGRRTAVLAAVQDTRGGRRALAWAWDEALLRAAALEIIDVVHDDASRTAAEEGLLRMVEAVRAEHARAPAVAIQVVAGDPVEVLSARTSEVQLLVMGSHGVGGLLHAVEPAVSDALTRLADCPVVVVPSPSPAPGPQHSPPPRLRAADDAAGDPRD